MRVVEIASAERVPLSLCCARVSRLGVLRSYDGDENIELARGIAS